jgi:hypothetical protein
LSESSSYYNRLIETVIELSVAKDWKSAVEEWSIHDFAEDDTLIESCICGKENLRYLFTIRNDLNGKTLFPIGSSCIKKFERNDLDEEVKIKEQLFKLLHAIENNQFLTLSAEFFSKKMLHYLFEEGAFKRNKYNNFNPELDYKFMLKMFNKKSELSSREEKKVAAIILGSIKPFLKKLLEDKRRRYE